ncbi:MAG: HIT family protein [Bacteroidetes bacterium]|nr:MAG: HIT family protein [Bacteroidota bacterium]
MATLFTKIIKGEIPSYKIAEDENFYAFLDVFPIAKGHALVVPKKEVDYLFDMDDETLGGLHVFAKKIAKAIEKAVPCKRIGTAVVGLEVPHAHLHLIPINKISDISFERPKLKLSEDEFKGILRRIKENL